MSTETIVALFRHARACGNSRCRICSLPASPASAVEAPRGVFHRRAARRVDDVDDPRAAASGAACSAPSPSHHGSVYDRSLESGGDRADRAPGRRPHRRHRPPFSKVPPSGRHGRARGGVFRGVGRRTDDRSGCGRSRPMVLSDSCRIDTDLPVGATAGSAGGEVLTLSAEALAVGKRVVNRGGHTRAPLRRRGRRSRRPCRCTASGSRSSVAPSTAIRARRTRQLQRARHRDDRDRRGLPWCGRTRASSRRSCCARKRPSAPRRCATPCVTRTSAVERIADGTPGPR